MLVPRWFVLNKRRLGPVALAGALILLVVAGIWSFSGESQADMQKNFETAHQNTLSSRSFRFAVESKLLGENEFYSKVEGESAMPDKVHIKGTVLKTPVEFTQINDSTYIRDPFSGKWLSLQGNNLSKWELFMSELNPLSNFNFKDIPEIRYVGEEEVDGEKLLAYELKPNVENVFLENQFDDFNYKIWVSKSDLTIRKALIKASKAGDEKGGLEISIKLWDYNRSLRIDVPQESNVTTQ
ncbi:hypothetical protein [Desulfotomaculum nigrificans]|uniref:hypothetical protein n=1 Tax=Desulfotomaculum nigrificans TaxID=1565 RepID=UPI0001FAE875|nr:hypothetical protein [Desulfotomaculum nigrificans]